MTVGEMELELQLLGPFAAIVNDQSLDSFRSNKTQALLAYLVTEAAFGEKGRPHPHGREQLMTLLWPRTLQQSAQVNLRQTLYQLRQAIPELPGPDKDRVPFILSDRRHVQINPDASYRLDVARFLRLLAKDPSPDELAAAVSLIRGPFLSDFYLPDSEPFEEWAAARRATLQQMALDALEALTEFHLERAEGEEAVVYARRQLALDELRESGHRQLMHALAQQGNRNAALAHYAEYRELLAEELGVEPSAESEALYVAIREGRTATEPAPVARPEPEARKKPPYLPSPATPFVGRRRELAEVAGHLQGNCRLLTLLGPGGSGKTRLALEVARHNADEYPHGAAFVDLAPLSDPGAIPTAISMAFDFRFASQGSPREQILDYLANKELLLVLDNFEHMLNGAELVDDILQTAPGVRAIATSRARLNLGAECLYEVSGLSLPKEDRLPEDGFETAEAVAMFMEHARRGQPGFALEEADKPAIAGICRLVEGLPLAIELAASWVRYLSPADIARELAEDLDFLKSSRPDLPERQRSMRAAFDHSWTLLDEAQRDVLMKLSVFRGGAGRRAAEAVTGASLYLLVDLADRSLLGRNPDSGRFAVHEVIRQFALERLEEAGEAENVRDAHSAYYLQALAERLPDLKGRDQLGALDAIEGDFENVRAAWRWALRQRQWRPFPQASQSLFLFALFRSRYQDGIELFEAARDAIPLPTTATERLARTYALAGGLGLLSWLGSHKNALAAVPELRAAAETLDDPAAVAFCQMMVGQVLSYDAEGTSEAMAMLEAAGAYYQQVRDSFYSAMALWRLGYARHRAGQGEETFDVERRGLELAREAGDRFVAGALLHNLGSATGPLEGMTEATESYYREAANLSREIGARANYALSLAHLALAPMWREGDLAQSRSLLQEALAIADEQNIPFPRASTLLYLANHWLLEGRYEKVLELTQETLALAEENTWGWYWATFLRGVTFLATGELADALPFVTQGLSGLLALGQVGWMDTCLTYYGVIKARQGEHERATELLALGLTSHHRGGLQIDPLIVRTRAELEEALGQERFAAAWERGKDLDPLAAAEEVLAALEQMETAG